MRLRMGNTAFKRGDPHLPQTNMKDKAVAIFTGVGLIAAIGFGSSLSQQTQATLRADNLQDAERCINVHNSDTIKGTTTACERVKTNYLSEEQKEQFAVAYAKHKEVKAKKDAEAKERLAKERAEFAAQQKAKRESERKAAAKFKAEGWFQVSSGIYGRWCTETCSKAEVIGNQSYWLMEVWAKDRAAGDIYAQINVLKDGTVIGWTNDTAYLSRGQKGVLTFTKYLPGYGSQYSAQLVKFSARG